ncbi:hypothetical protein BDR06DRAFT_726829 [Suillus hirtellus]|nr:hypothetical protein BDR06DRAFT_726829 [Suillus hirtellus]
MGLDGPFPSIHSCWIQTSALLYRHFSGQRFNASAQQGQSYVQVSSKRNGFHGCVKSLSDKFTSSELSDHSFFCRSQARSKHNTTMCGSPSQALSHCSSAQDFVGSLMARPRFDVLYLIMFQHSALWSPTAPRLNFATTYYNPSQVRSVVCRMYDVTIFQFQPWCLAKGVIQLAAFAQKPSHLKN